MPRLLPVRLRRVRRSIRALAWIACALFGSGIASAQTLEGGQTTFAFEARILADLGIQLENVSTTASASRSGGLGFAVAPAASSLAFAAPAGDFERFSALALRHAGGFALAVGGQLIAFDGARLEAAPPPHFLRVVDSAGQAWLDVGHPHAQLSPDQRALTIENADLLVTPALAVLLGRPELEGSYVGVLDTSLVLTGLSGIGIQGGDCIPDLGDPVDVELTVLDSLTQAAREAGGRVSMAPSAELLNNGPGDVSWYRSIAPSNPVGPHPYLALHMYRLSGDVLEQIGRADLKHAFYATNTGCPCPGGNVLFVGCEDLYGVNTNLGQYYLGPRDELDALTRAWNRVGSHFDGSPVDDFRDHIGSSVHDDFEHRLVVQESDLQTPGASYFMEAWYLAPNDTDLLNSLGHRQVTPSLGGSTWAFPNAAPMELGSILDVWVDPVNPGPGELSKLVSTGEGNVQLAVVTEDLGSGVYHYEWAFQNFDYENQIRTFSVPVRKNMIVTNTGFGDSDGNPANDWTINVMNGFVTWSAPAGNALDWGLLYNFRMDVDSAPLVTRATAQALDGGGSLLIQTLGPAPLAVPTLPWRFPAVGAVLLVAALASLRSFRLRA